MLALPGAGTRSASDAWKLPDRKGIWQFHHVKAVSKGTLGDPVGRVAPPLPDPPRSPILEATLGLCASLLPFGLAVSRAASSGQWRDDLPAVRDVGLVAVGIGGGLSTVITQACGLLPIGPHAFRAALGSALGLAGAAALLYTIASRLLRLARPSSPRMAAVLAAIATLTAALSPTWQREATVGGGAMLAICAALAAISLAGRCAAEPRGAAGGAPAHRFIALGALLGAVAAESPPTGVAAMTAIVALFWLRARLPVGDPRSRPRSSGFLPHQRVLFAGAAAGGLVFVLLVAPAALRPLAPRAWVDVGLTFSATSLSALDIASAKTTAMAAWGREVGVVSLFIAVFGVAIAALRVIRRRGPSGAASLGSVVVAAHVAALVVLVLADTLFPASAAGVLSADPLTSLRSLAVGAITVASALGVHEVVALLLRMQIPLARAGAVLVVVFHLTLVALTSEEAGFVADRSAQLAAEEWSDQAMGGIEPASAILVRSPAMCWRLWAARITRGERPDVVVIPVPLLARGSVAKSLLATDRRLEPLLRDFALTGEPSEFALSKVADVRPLHVELDRAWSKRLIAHLAVDGMWLEYAPQPLGASDRKLGAAASLGPLQRVLAATSSGLVVDASTSRVMAETLRAQADVLATLGERDAAKAFLDRVTELLKDDPFMAEGSPLLRALDGLKPGDSEKAAPAGRSTSEARRRK